MFKKLLLTIAGLLLIVLLIGGTFAMMVKKMIASGANQTMPAQPVTAAPATQDSWQPTLDSVGSLSAVQGVVLSAQLDGTVAGISFEAGSKVKAGELLVQMDISAEQAQLRAAEAQVELAKVNLQRSKELLDKNTIPKSQFDTDDAAFKQAQAQAQTIQATIDKKTIRAPFSGKLGVRLVNLGQTLKSGDPIVSLQALDPIFTDFYLPQQELAQVADGLQVRIACDAFPGQFLAGKVTAVSPDVDSASRNVRVQATLPNASEKLRPGMFVKVQVLLPEKESVVIIPSTSVLYAPYGDSVFVVEDHTDEKTGRSSKVANQHFVRLGRSQGDFVSVLSGIKPGDMIVTSGAFRLRKGMPVMIDNTLAPKAEAAPKPADS